MAGTRLPFRSFTGRQRARKAARGAPEPAARDAGALSRARAVVPGAGMPWTAFDDRSAVSSARPSHAPMRAERGRNRLGAHGAQCCARLDLPEGHQPRGAPRDPLPPRERREICCRAGTSPFRAATHRFAAACQAETRGAGHTSP